MSTIVNRVAKGSKLTFTEVDANFSNLNTDKAEMTHSDTPPSSATVGDFWFDTSTLTTYVYYNSQWVQSVVASGGNAGGSGISLASLSVGAEGTASGDGSVTYNNSTGVFTYTPPVIGGSTTVYANTSSLPSVASATTGDMAFVTANKRFYVFNGSAWYSVALTNTAPTIGGALASYALATDGSATVVTITASDPESDPIVYSHTTSGLGSEATITQGTGGNTNVFTVTPSTNSAHAGDFSVTFSITDGANVANSTSTFTLLFSQPQTRGTVLKIKTSGTNGRANVSFDDSSASNHSLTANGDVYQTTFAPYFPESGYWSNHFQTQDDDLDFSAINMGTGSWTIEGWIKPTTLPSALSCFFANGSNDSGLLQIGTVGTAIRIQDWSLVTTGTGVVALNEWTHVAIQVNASSGKIYTDGRLRATYGSKPSTRHLTTIGSNRGSYANEGFRGYMSDVRVSNVERYSDYYNVPTEPFVHDSNTLLLACGSNRHMDRSNNNVTINANSSGSGTVKILPQSPYKPSDIWETANGGSAFFDGSDSLLASSSTDFAFGTGDFLVECWVYPTNLSSSLSIIAGTGTSGNIAYFHITTSQITLGTNTVYIIDASTGATTINNNVWTHIAWARSSGTTYVFKNGVVIGSASDSTEYIQHHLKLGTNSGTGQTYTGYISDFRLVKGSNPRGTSTFTLPTAPASVDSNTKLKLNFAQAGIFNSIGNADIELVGNTSESTTQTKYSNTSILMDNNNDYIVSESDIYKVGTQPFQFEAWVYCDGATVTQGVFQGAKAKISTGSQGNSGTFGILTSTGSMWSLYHNGLTITSTALTANAWHHVAFVRAQGRTRMFLNGLQIADVADTNNYNEVDTFHIGGIYQTDYIWDGHIADARFLIDHTTYPNERPQEALTAPSGTVLQFANASTIPTSPNGLTLSVEQGSPTVSTFTPPDSTVTHSIRYDGNDRHLFASNSNLVFGNTSEFTIEMYIYLVSQSHTYASILDWRETNPDADAISITYDANNYYIYNAGYLINNIPRVLGKWEHIAFQRRNISGTLTHEFYLNGVLAGSTTTAVNWASGLLRIGGSYLNEYGDFFLSDLRINNSNAIYSSTFTPPTGAL